MNELVVYTNYYECYDVNESDDILSSIVVVVDLSVRTDVVFHPFSFELGNVDTDLLLDHNELAL